MKIGGVLRGKLGNDNVIVRLSSKIINEAFCIISIISPTLNCKLRYRYNYGKKLNINNPKSFIEKCCWYKVNIVNKNSIFRLCSDKYAVRQYIKRLGCGEILNNLIAVYDRIDDIDYSSLPPKFVIKLNDGCGYYIICTDHNSFEISEAQKKLNKWWKEHNYLLYAEMQNKAKVRKIIIEEYLEGYKESKQPIDYKIYCFDGVPKAILCVWDRDCQTKEVFMDVNWNYISEAFAPNMEIKCNREQNHSYPERPRDLDLMIQYAKKLSKPFPFVRCDFYQTNKGPVFGELTFTAAGGMFTSQTDPKILDMSKLFNVPCDFKIKKE